MEPAADGDGCGTSKQPIATSRDKQKAERHTRKSQTRTKLVWRWSTPGYV
jgi:hypothetical protein